MFNALGHAAPMYGSFNPLAPQEWLLNELQLPATVAAAFKENAVAGPGETRPCTFSTPACRCMHAYAALPAESASAAAPAS